MTKLTKTWAQLVKEQAQKQPKQQVVTIEKKAEIIKAVATMPEPEPQRRQRRNDATEMLLRRSRGSEWATIYRIKYGRK